MSLKKYISEISIRSDSVLLIVDVQPEYDFSFDLSEFVQYINTEYNNGKKIVYLYNGYETLGMIKEEDLKYWLTESVDFNEEFEDLIFQQIIFYDKGYAFFRYCIDSGIDDQAIVALVKQMIDWNINDSRDLEKDFWIDFVSQNKNHLDDIEEVKNLLENADDLINIPDLMSVLEGLNNITLVGGDVNECLKEVEIALMALNKQFTINNDFTF